jgi:hypothetical protein
MDGVQLDLLITGTPQEPGFKREEQDSFRFYGFRQAAAASRKSDPPYARGTLFSEPNFYCMARYFFNVHGERSGPDWVGEELPDHEAAWKEATVMAGEIFKDIDGKFRPGQDWSLEVTDERRNPLYFIRVIAEEI